jgi:hypothetical protein
MDDTDLREFFLDFVLHRTLRELVGVDLTLFRTNKEIAALGGKLSLPAGSIGSAAPWA